MALEGHGQAPTEEEKENFIKLVREFFEVNYKNSKLKFATIFIDKSK